MSDYPDWQADIALAALGVFAALLVVLAWVTQ